MNNITVIVFSILLIGILLYYILKNHYVNQLNKALKNNQYNDVIRLSEKPIVRRFLSSYVCDLYKVRAYSFLKNDNKFKEILDEVIEKDYPFDKRKDILELYFHYFLLKDDREYAEKLLQDIRSIGEPLFSSYNEQAYEVMMNHTTDLVDAMEAAINTKQFSGFPLGVIVYMIGKQYLLLGNKEEARTYFYNSLACFSNNAIYVASAKKYIDELSEELGVNTPEY